MEYKTLCITDVDAMDRSYCSSLVVAVKFFDMASDIKAMKEMMLLQWMILGYQRLIPGSSDGRCGCISPLR